MIIFRTLLLLLSLSILGCTSSSSGPSPQQPALDGTSDSGGGNGVDNKAYEAYIVQPDQLPAFKQYILPRIEKLATLVPKGFPFVDYFKRWLLYKTWYVAPVKLNTISKDVIGVSFSDDKTEQLALQMKKSIWINSERFSSMPPKAQAALIAHEMVMSLYYLKFKSWKEVCAEKIFPDMQCNEVIIDILNELFPGTTPKPFDSDDYENIRSVTGSLLGDREFTSAKELDSLFFQYNFDRRFTLTMGLEDEETMKKSVVFGTEKLSSAELKRILNFATNLNQLPNQCKAIRTNQIFNCEFTFEESLKTSIQGYQFPILSMTTTSLEKSIPFKFSASAMLMGEREGGSVEFVQLKKRIAYFVLWPEPFPTSPVVGTAFRGATLVTVQDLAVPNSPITLLGLISTPGVVAGTGNGDCTYAKPSTTGVNDDAVLVYSKYLSEFDKALLHTRATSIPPVTTCRPF